MNISFSLDLLIVIVFLIGALLIGFFSARKIRTIKEYVLFYKNYHPAILGLSMAMVIFGSGTIVGAVSEVYKVGIVYILATSGYIINSLITVKFIIPKIGKKFEGMITVADIFKGFYGKKAEKLSAIISLIFDLGANATQLMVIGKIISYFFGLDYIYSLVMTGLIMIAYSSLGGIRAVTIMDVIKCIMLTIFIPVLANIVVFKAGGMIEILQRAPKEHISFFDHKDFLKYFVLFIFFSIPIHMIQPIVMQRLLMIKDHIVSQKSMLVYALIRFILIWVTLAISLSIIVISDSVEPQDVLYASIVNTLPPILKGLVISSILAIVMCKADAHLNSLGIIISKNLIPSKFNKKVGELKLIRASTILLGFIGLFIASIDFSMISLIIFIEALWGISLGIPLLAYIMGIKQTTKQFWAYILIILPIFAFFYFLDPSYYTPLIGVALGVTILFFIKLFSKNKKKVTLDVLSFKEIFRKNCGFSEKTKKVISIFEKIRNFSAKRVEMVGADYFAFSIFFGMNYTIPVFMLGSSFSHFNISIFLRIISVLLCCILLVKNFWPFKLRKYFPLFWHMVLMYTLSFMPTLTLFLNDWESKCLIDIVLSILLLVFLTDWIVFVIAMSVGMVLAIVVSLFVQKFYFPTDVGTGYIAIYSFLFSILTGLIFTRKKENMFFEKVRIASLFGGVVAHEMRTFLLGLKNYVYGTKKHFNTLINGYEEAVITKAIHSDLSKDQVMSLKKSNFEMERIINNAFSFIDILLLNIKAPILTKKSVNHSILSALKKALLKNNRRV